MMKADVELRLVHDGQNWVVSNNNIKAQGDSLSDLDNDVRRALLDSGLYPSGSQLTVFMGFDFSTIPAWLHQYHNHYFNRTISFEL